MPTYASIESHELQHLRDVIKKNASLRTALANHEPLNVAKGNMVSLIDGTLRALGVSGGDARAALLGTGGGLWGDNMFPISVWRGDSPPGSGSITEGTPVLGQDWLWSFTPGNPMFDEAAPINLRNAIADNLNVIYGGQGVMLPASEPSVILTAFTAGTLSAFRLAKGGRVWRQLYSVPSITLNDLQHSTTVGAVFKAAALAIRLHVSTVYGLFAWGKDTGNIINLPGNDIADANPDN